MILTAARPALPYSSAAAAAARPCLSLAMSRPNFATSTTATHTSPTNLQPDHDSVLKHTTSSSTTSVRDFLPLTTAFCPDLFNYPTLHLGHTSLQEDQQKKGKNRNNPTCPVLEFTSP